MAQIWLKLDLGKEARGGKGKLLRGYSALAEEAPGAVFKVFNQSSIRKANILAFPDDHMIQEADFQ
jgi:hypothetical protein